MRSKHDVKKVDQRRAVYQEFISPESLHQGICMLIRCSYVQNSDIPRTDQSRMKWSFKSTCLLLDARLGLSAIAFAPSLSPKMSTRMPLRYGWRKTKTALVNKASLDPSHKAACSASQVAVVTHFCVLLFQPMAALPDITSTPDTDLRSLDAAE